MNKKKHLVILMVIFIATFLVFFKDKNTQYEVILLKAKSEENKVSDTNTQVSYNLVLPSLAHQKIEKESFEKIAERNAEIIRITERNNRKNNVHFNSDNLLSISNITVDELNSIFAIKDKPYMLEITGALVEAEKEYGINALFLAGLVAQESYWGEIPAGNGDNLTGMGVYSPSHKGFTYEGSKYNNIMATAEAIRNNYLSVDGPYYNGISTTAVNVRYCLKAYSSETDYEWSYNINTIAEDLNNVYHTQVKDLEYVPKELTTPKNLFNRGNQFE